MAEGDIDKTDLLLLLLYAPDHAGKRAGAMYGITRLEKLMFLLEKEGGLSSFRDEFDFEPYRFGPFSTQVYDTLEALEGWGFLEMRSRSVSDHYAAAEVERLDEELSDEEGDVPSTNDRRALEERPIREKVITLTARGRLLAGRVAEKVGEEERAAIARIKQKYGRMSLRHLIAYVYETYPKYAVKSELV